MSWVYRRPPDVRQRRKKVPPATRAGGAAPVQFLRPDSDIDVAGWTTAPLWSKIDEVTPADGDFISEL